MILLKMFKKTALSLTIVEGAKADTLNAQLKEMVSFFDLNTGKSMKLLWNFFRPMTLSTQRVFEVERSINEVAASISYFASDKDGMLLNRSVMNNACYNNSTFVETFDPSNIAFHASNELKSNLIEGAATLYVIDEDKSKNAMQLARSLSSVPELVKSQLQELSKHLASESRVTLPSVWSLALLPILDHASTINEMELITKIMHTLADQILDMVRL